jgi:DNA-directed RNA polymerase subunit omega
VKIKVIKKRRNVKMMVKPTVSELLTKVDNRFRLVIATSKRARQIATGSEILTDEDDESPVTLAADEIAEGKVKVC